MARIVLGLATSHTPLFTLDSSEWRHRAQADIDNPRLNLSDGRWLSYPELLAETGPVHAETARPEELERKAALCEAALDHLKAALEAARPDVVLIVGDDQGELFGPDNQPAFAIYHHNELVTSDAFGHEGQPDWVHKMGRGYLMDERRIVQGHAGFSLQLIDGMVERGVDVATVADIRQGSGAGLGHAFGFVVKRLMGDRAVPIVPLLLNTYFPPNVPTAARCHDIGLILRQAIEAAPDSLRVAVVASGGLSHFVVDEALDRGVLQAMIDDNATALRSIPRCALHSGSSEILNWVLTAAAVRGLPVQSSTYLPLYRTPAGTGVGAAFVVWAAANPS